MRVGQGLGHAVDGPGGDARLLTPDEPIRARLSDGDGLDLALELALVHDAIADGGKARVIHEAVEPEDAAEARPEPAVRRAHGEAAVARAKGLVRGVEAVGRAEPARDLSRIPVLGRLPRRERQPRLEERGVHELPAPRHAPRPERAEDAEDAEEARAQVGDRHAHLHRWAVGTARRAHDAAHALGNEVVAAAVRVGPGLPEARDRTVDEPRIDLPQRLVVDAEPARHARPIVFDQHVGGCDQPCEDGDGFRPLQVEREAALVPVHGEKGTRDAGRDLELHVSARLSPRRLHLDHVRAHVAEQHAAVRTGHDLGQIDDANAVERAFGVHGPA